MVYAMTYPMVYSMTYPMVYAMTYPMMYAMTYPIVCWVSRLKRKHDVKSLMFSTQTWWLSGRSGSRSPEKCVHLEHYACCAVMGANLLLE